MKRLRFRKDLGKPSLIQKVRACFASINDPIVGRKFTLCDYLMAGLAVFVFKYSSLLNFDKATRTEKIKRNLKNLFGIDIIPSDSGLRKRLDILCPSSLRKVFTSLFALVQRGKLLEPMTMFNGMYLLAVDGTGFFSSNRVCCDHCCEKVHKNGSKTWFHQMLVAAICHPYYRYVVPLMPEPIMRSDGATKNDCEQAAAARFFPKFREEHPHLRCVVLQMAYHRMGHIFNCSKIAISASSLSPNPGIISIYSICWKKIQMFAILPQPIQMALFMSSDILKMFPSMHRILTYG